MKNSEENKNSKTIDEILLGRDVRSSKSVRTTFRLTENSLKALEYLNQNFILTQKGLFSFIAEALTRESEIKGVVVELSKVVNINQNTTTRRKSFVVEKKAIKIFKRTSNDHEVSRDSLINSSLLTLHRLLLKSSEKDKENSEKAMDLLNEVSDILMNFDSKLRNLLGDDHNIVQGFEYVPNMLDILILAVERYIKSGDDFDPHSL